MFRSVCAWIIGLACPLAGHGQQADAPPAPSWTFGVSLTTGQHSELYSLFLVREHGLQVIATEPITRSQFVLQAQGILPSKANPGGENLFLRHGVTGCLHPEDDTAGVENCHVFDDLWKLRFWEYPFQPRQGQHPGRGWAERPMSPSPRQMLLLSDYGILHINGMARGENAFRLLRDVGDKDWVENYRQGY